MASPQNKRWFQETAPSSGLDQVSQLKSPDMACDSRTTFSWVSADHCRQLWNWDITEFVSTDCYLYLLLHKYCAYFLGAVSILTLGFDFPLIWTAASVDKDGKPKAFFERNVITNVPPTDFLRLWLLYVC